MNLQFIGEHDTLPRWRFQRGVDSRPFALLRRIQQLDLRCSSSAIASPASSSIPADHLGMPNSMATNIVPMVDDFRRWLSENQTAANGENVIPEKLAISNSSLKRGRNCPKERGHD